MKRLLFGLIAVLMVACSASAPPPDESAEEVEEAIAPTTDPAEVGVEPAEPDAAAESPTAQPTEEAAAKSPRSKRLPVIRPAPELQNEVWLNTDEPLRLADLRGQVVLIDMWTFG